MNVHVVTTPTRNLALMNLEKHRPGTRFDAVINSMLCRTVGRAVGTRLFTWINGYDSLPERLLRSLPGWPDEFNGALTALQRINGLLYGGRNSAQHVLCVSLVARSTSD